MTEIEQLWGDRLVSQRDPELDEAVLRRQGQVRSGGSEGSRATERPPGCDVPGRSAGGETRWIHEGT